MVGRTLAELGIREVVPTYVAVQAPVFPFAKFANVDPVLGPEMRSTGEVMGIDTSFPRAFAKAALGTGLRLPDQGRAFISVQDEDKNSVGDVAWRLHQLGFELVATHGTAAYLRRAGLLAEGVNKVREGRPHIVDRMKNGEIHFVVNTVDASHSVRDSVSIRRTALLRDIPYFTTIDGARAAAGAIDALRQRPLTARSLQEYLKR